MDRVRVKPATGDTSPLGVSTYPIMLCRFTQLPRFSCSNARNIKVILSSKIELELVAITKH